MDSPVLDVDDHAEHHGHHERQERHRGLAALPGGPERPAEKGQRNRRHRHQEQDDGRGEDVLERRHTQLVEIDHLVGRGNERRDDPGIDARLYGTFDEGPHGTLRLGAPLTRVAQLPEVGTDPAEVHPGVGVVPKHAAELRADRLVQQPGAQPERSDRVRLVHDDRAARVEPADRHRERKAEEQAQKPDGRRGEAAHQRAQRLVAAGCAATDTPSDLAGDEENGQEAAGDQPEVGEVEGEAEGHVRSPQ
jgi:hypothetical protein